MFLFHTHVLAARQSRTHGSRHLPQVGTAHPGRYRPTQIRTLQRGLGKLRARLLVTFDDQWGEEVVNGQLPAPELHAEVVGGVS
jgi:hypothetical protein